MNPKTGRSKNKKGPPSPTKVASSSVDTKTGGDVSHTPHIASDVLPLFALLLVSCWLFSNGLHGDLVFDDSAALTDNNDTKSDLTPLRNVFVNDFWGTHVLNISSHRSYRPTVVLTFRLQHYLMGYRHDVTTLHVVNYIMAYINVCLVYYLARLYMKPHVDSADGVADRPLHVAWRRCAIPFAAALLFLAHPVHVDSVTSIVGRCELMCCFFGLCALFTEHAYLCVWGRGWHVHAGCVLLSTVLMILSVTSKDSGIAYCGVFVVHAVGIYCWKRASLRRTIMCVILSVAQVVGYFGFRMYALGALSLHVKDMRRTETPQYFVPPGVWHWLAIRWVAAMKNLELLFFPTKLAHEYAYNCVAHLETLSDERLPMFCAVTLVVLCYVCALVYRVLRHRSRGAGMQLVAVMWAVVLYAPVSHFFVTVGTFIAERCLYSSSVGVVLLLAYVFVPAEFPNTRLRWAGCAALCALVLLWMIVCHRRIPDWDSALRLYSSGVAVCPMSGKAHYLVGVEVVNRSVISYMTEEERWWFERAWELDDALVDAYGYVGLAEMGSRHYAAGYSILRRCAARSVSMCIDTLVDARAKFYVGMPAHEQLLDQADLMEDPIGALALRERAVSIAEEKAAVCEQSRTFESMRRAYESLGFVWESNSSSEESDGFLCQLAPRYVSVKLRCSSEAMAEGGGDVDGEDVDEQLAAYEITSVVDVMSRCRLRWTNPDFVEDDARLVLGLGNLSATLSAAVQRVTALLPLFEEEEIEVEVQRGLRTLIRMQYCQAHQLLRNTTLLQHVEKVYPEGLKLMRKYVETDGEMHRVSLQGTLVDSEHNNSVTSWEGYSDDALCTFPPELE